MICRVNRMDIKACKRPQGRSVMIKVCQETWHIAVLLTSVFGDVPGCIGMCQNVSERADAFQQSSFTSKTTVNNCVKNDKTYCLFACLLVCLFVCLFHFVMID